MSTIVCLAANTLYYPQGGGHLWVYLNWALGLRALGCSVIWLELANPFQPIAEQRACVAALKNRLERYGMGQALAVSPWDGQPFVAGVEDCLDLDAAAESDVLLNLSYDLPAVIVQRFRRSALIDIDPGLLQIWMSAGQIDVAAHDVYFTTGETVGQPGTRIPDTGIRWEYTSPCVALDWWPLMPAAPEAPFTTVSHWNGGDNWVQYDGDDYSNSKREGFLPFLEVPRHTRERLELALCIGDDTEDVAALCDRGWQVRDAHTVASTPWDYQRYIQESRGEFSCVKPSCTRLQNAWVSDRTLCYLASGKPAVVQHTGPSRFLPDDAGLLRFRDPEEAVRRLEAVAADYPRHCALARALAEEYFDARQVAASVLERAL